MVDHLPRPTWVVVVCLESQPLSGSSVFNTRILDAVAGGPQKDDACSNSAFHLRVGTSPLGSSSLPCKE